MLPRRVVEKVPSARFRSAGRPLTVPSPVRARGHCRPRDDAVPGIWENCGAHSFGRSNSRADRRCISSTASSGCAARWEELSRLRPGSCRADGRAATAPGTVLSHQEPSRVRAVGRAPAPVRCRSREPAGCSTPCRDALRDERQPAPGRQLAVGGQSALGHGGARWARRRSVSRR